MKRSVIVVFIDALRSMPSRVIACRGRPTRLAGMMNSGSSTSASSVSRHSRNAIAASVTTSVTTFDTTEPSVPVRARWAPITSLFIRLISAPVCVRVKNAIGMRCTWSNSATRRSKMRPSPMRADHQRSGKGRRWAMPWSKMALISSGGARPFTTASSTMMVRNPSSILR